VPLNGRSQSKVQPRLRQFMELIHQFHRVETANRLFELGKEQSLPFWSIVRYHAYVKYYYPEHELKRLGSLKRHSLKDYLWLGWHLLRAAGKLSTSVADTVVLTVSRSRDPEGKGFDKSALALIKLLGRRALVLEATSGRALCYDHVYDFVHVYRRFYRSRRLPLAFFQCVSRAMTAGFGDCKISYQELDTLYHAYQSDLCYYRWLFRWRPPSQVFIAEGNPKAILTAAREVGAKTYLLQHASIEVDEVDYSHPEGVTPDSNVLFPDHVLTFGDYWCRGFNVPAKSITPIGNDFFDHKPDVAGDRSILFVSTIAHGLELRSLARGLAPLHPDRTLNFKLHPNEFHFASDYSEYFKDHKNISVVTTETDVNVLVARSDLVVLIVSTVLYEALHQNRKVAVYRRVNYRRQTCVAHLPNVFFIDQAQEVARILESPAVENGVSFFEPTNLNLLKELVAA